MTRGPRRFIRWGRGPAAAGPRRLNPEGLLELGLVHLDVDAAGTVQDEADDPDDQAGHRHPLAGRVHLPLVHLANVDQAEDEGDQTAEAAAQTENAKHEYEY